MEVEEGTDTDDAGKYHYQIANELAECKYHLSLEKTTFFIDDVSLQLTVPKYYHTRPRFCEHA